MYGYQVRGGKTNSGRGRHHHHNYGNLILKWTMGASQLATGSNNNSIIHITMATAVSGYPVFTKCKHKRLNYKLGEDKWATPWTPTPTDPAALISLVESSVGWSVVNAMQTGNGKTVMAPSIPPEAKKSKRYDILELSMIRWWTSTKDILALQHIWSKFQDTKNTKTHRVSAMETMMQWATIMGLEIYQGVYL